jgi:hypothetical protein
MSQDNQAGDKALHEIQRLPCHGSAAIDEIILAQHPKPKKHAQRGGGLFVERRMILRKEKIAGYPILSQARG